MNIIYNNENNQGLTYNKEYKVICADPYGRFFTVLNDNGVAIDIESQGVLVYAKDIIMEYDENNNPVTIEDLIERMGEL